MRWWPSDYQRNQVKRSLGPAFAILFLASAPPGIAAVGFLKSERTTRFNKVCVYDVLGSAHEINVSSVEPCPLTIDVDLPAPSPTGQDEGGSRIQLTGKLVAERVSGMNKICEYECLGDTCTYTISAASLCPLTRKF